ncbi:MAG: hypothetical protein V2I33_00635 [Kangiellaceae bacterium]|jgi:DNA polymerase-3 subunit delta'|nr:hypothetical protein [Kangiellaceae bacterium]
MIGVYPWHQDAWHKLQTAIASERLPHGLLFVGHDGCAGFELANHLARYLLCQSNEQDRPCNDCKSCHLLTSSTHPDFYCVEPLDGKKQISIDQVRQLTTSIRETSALAGWRCAIIRGAEKMTVNGFNALLKTLEEPGNKTLLILTAADSSRIPATILSRCQVVDCGKVPEQLGIGWLQQQKPGFELDDYQAVMLLAGNSPLTALALLEKDAVREFGQLLEQLSSILLNAEVVSIADRSKLEPAELLQYWEILVNSVIKYQFGHNLALNAWHDALTGLAENTQQQLLFKLRDSLLFQLKELQQGITLNTAMQFDELTAQWRQCRSVVTS